MRKLKDLLRIGKGNKKSSERLQGEALEKKAVEGAEKAVREYRRVFERLAEYDRK